MSVNKTPRVPLYDRLPEIYRQRDGEQNPPGQLEAYLKIVEDVFGTVHENIGELYRDLFIETCDDWVVPYIGDLLGTSHLSGSPWTLRADVADTIPLRRRKGTLHALELLAYDLTEWAAFCLEVRETLAWTQNLNHQRPDIPAAVQGVHGIAHGGTATIRDPAVLSLLGTPFDPFSYSVDVKPTDFGVMRHNLPLVAVFLWRLVASQAGPSQPVWRATASPASGAPRAVRFDIEPTGKPVVLFNISQLTPSADAAMVADLAQVPGPILPALLTTNAPFADPQDYVSVTTYDATATPPAPISETSDALQFFLPQTPFKGDVWTFRGANLCAWEAPLVPPLQDREIAIDPVIGRVVFGVKTASEASAVKTNLLLTYAYGTPGPVGAQPDAPPPPADSAFEGATVKMVRLREDPLALQHALDNLDTAAGPVIVEIDDSLTHVLDVKNVAGIKLGDAVPSLQLAYPLVIRATAGNRPVVQLANNSLAFRPVQVVAGGGLTQDQVDTNVANLKVTLQGIFWNGDLLPAGQALITRVAVPSLNLVNCTLDPGGVRLLKGTRSAIRPATSLDLQFGFTDSGEYDAFKPTPVVTAYRSIAGPLLMEIAYQLQLVSSIVDGGAGVDEDGSKAIAIGSAADPLNGYGAVAGFDGVTVFGQSRLRSAQGSGGIFCHRFAVQNDQVGCIRFSYFALESNVLPQNFGCVFGTSLGFVGQTFGVPGYGQLLLDSDSKVLQNGPNSDEMGAYGFLLNSHKWRNLQIRFREFVPAGVKALLLPVT